ncbi:hypothetical protein [Cellulosimicrobium arenosum]|uniref:PIN domain-containing protein n=1 Tax=Cellulosimicrobium arenosum TaxID=2708133 RepID=A0A927G948_9MICO|nr:hypothetical protein [Cellulosimicrobium arenosum]MBD8078844.1 hypothetical protein [Cellulosimicrobium arenosum]
MTRYAIDAPVAIRLARDQFVVPEGLQLVGPNVLRSDVLSLLYRGVRSGELTAQEGAELLDRVTTTRVRLLGDRVSRANAWKIADGLGWDDPRGAEYLAVARLQADALVTDDQDLVRAADGIVRVATYAELVAGG